HTHPQFYTFLYPPPPPPHLYTLSLHDALPISSSPPYTPSHFPTTHPPRKSAHRKPRSTSSSTASRSEWPARGIKPRRRGASAKRSEEHTSELQSPYDLVCRLLLEKKKRNKRIR